MKKLVLLFSLVAFLAVSCAKKEQEPQVSFTPCQQTKATTSELSDTVNVEFTNEGVKITHYNFEVTCDFSAVNVTHSFVNGVLRITQQGYPNQAKCICYSDVSYTINGISKDEVNVIFINGEQVYCYNEEEPVNPKIGTITMTTLASEVLFYMETAQEADSISIDWGDGEGRKSYATTYVSAIPFSYCYLYASHSYSSESSHDITITNDNITKLYVSGLQLIVLDVSRNTALAYLYCDNNQLTALDLSNNTALTHLYCRDNQLSASALNDLFTSLYDRYDNTVSYTKQGPIDYWYWIYIIENPGTSSCDVSIAQAKGWRVSPYDTQR